MTLLAVTPLQFRFRGKLNRLLRIYECFLSHEDQALHPAQVARDTGLPLQDVSARLAATPELFVRLPKRPDGLTRYRLTTVTRTRTPEEVVAQLRRLAQRETWTLYAGTGILLCLLVAALMIILPSLGLL